MEDTVYIRKENLSYENLIMFVVSVFVVVSMDKLMQWDIFAVSLCKCWETNLTTDPVEKKATDSSEAFFLILQ